MRAYERGPPAESFEVEDGLFLKGNRRREKKATSSKHEARVMRIFITILSAVFIVVVVVLLLTHTGSEPNREASAAAHTGTIYASNFNMKQNWGAYSPYFDTGVPFEGISKTALDGEFSLPNRCAYKQVHVLHRHGDRYPAGSSAHNMEKMGQRLEKMARETPQQGNEAWLNEWKYSLQTESLVGAGIGALFDSGAKFWGSHGRLLYSNAAALPGWTDSINLWPNGTRRSKPVLRATSQDRIEASARAWAAGFFGLKSAESYDLVLMDEVKGNNNSLAGYMACPNADRPGGRNGGAHSKNWTNIYLADAAQRIQKLLPALGPIEPGEVLAIQDLCVFETAAFGSSAFCGWFTEQEWRGFEYHTDLKFYGDSAWGAYTGPATALSWVAELRARLLHVPITKPGFGVNTTLDSNRRTFPLHQPFYADFTHDSVIVSVLTALQLPFTKQNLPDHKIKVPRQLIVSRLTPFAARLYVEVLECGERGNAADYVRLRLNDRVLPIGGLKHCEDNEKGLCSFQDFVRSLEWALDAVNFDEVCFGEIKQA